MNANAFETFRGNLEAYIIAYRKAQYPTCESLHNVEVTLQPGKKYARIVRKDYTLDSTGARKYNHGSAYGFVELATGNIYMAAGWKAPAKHVRGNIACANVFGTACQPNGVASLR